MPDVTYRSDVTVQLVQHMGSDEMICRAARVSTKGTGSLQTDESAGLISFLMREHHGSPFEHNAMTFLVEAPIFVWREHMRHRIGFSYNETSGRYSEFKPVFYVPSKQRPLVQVGKPGAYTFEVGYPEDHEEMRLWHQDICAKAWSAYEEMLAYPLAREVARNVLPVSLYSSAYVTCNVRSLLNFLTLRNAPQALYEIRMVAEQYESILATLFPLTYAAWLEAGRVAP